LRMQIDLFNDNSTKGTFVAYCDGACKGNGKQGASLGGWGLVIRNQNKPQEQHEAFGGHPDTTNNQMELTAAIETLLRIPKGSEVLLYTDSTYVIKGLTEWIQGWVRRGWQSSAGGPVKNQELWQRLYALYQERKVTMKWVRGHNGDEGNERADQLANRGVEAIRASKAA